MLHFFTLLGQSEKRAAGSERSGGTNGQRSAAVLPWPGRPPPGPQTRSWSNSSPPSQTDPPNRTNREIYYYTVICKLRVLFIWIFLFLNNWLCVAASLNVCCLHLLNNLRILYIIITIKETWLHIQDAIMLVILYYVNKLLCAVLLLLSQSC